MSEGYSSIDLNKSATIILKIGFFSSIFEYYIIKNKLRWLVCTMNYKKYNY